VQQLCKDIRIPTRPDATHQQQGLACCVWRPARHACVAAPACCCGHEGWMGPTWLPCLTTTQPRPLPQLRVSAHRRATGHVSAALPPQAQLATRPHTHYTLPCACLLCCAGFPAGARPQPDNLCQSYRSTCYTCLKQTMLATVGHVIGIGQRTFKISNVLASGDSCL
jgi:hypothetical protein